MFQALLRADAPELDTAMAFCAGAPICRDVMAVLSLGPTPASMARLAEGERAQLLLQAERRAPHARRAVGAARRPGRLGAAVWLGVLRWSLDVDPQELRGAPP